MRFNLWLRELAGRLDAVGVVGIGLAIMGITLYLTAVLPAREEIASLQSRLARAAHSDAQPPDAAVAAAARSADQLARFDRLFPALAEAPLWVLRIHQLAERNGLTLETGEYRLVKDAALGMTRYQITLPLNGTYAQTRHFIAQVLRDVPAAALDDIVIKRESIGAASTQTRVQLALYLLNDK